MKSVKTQFGKSCEADFETFDWTFRLDENMQIRSGDFAIVDKPIYDEMVKCLTEFVTNNEMTSELKERCKSVLHKSIKGE